jgi:hypothetical protein
MQPCPSSDGVSVGPKPDKCRGADQTTNPLEGRTYIVMNQALVSFEPTASAVTTTNKFGTTIRLQTAKEFKTAKGLKGQDGRRQYNAYLSAQGKASTAGLAAALTGGELLVRSYRDSKGSVGVNFIKASSIKDPVAHGASAAQPTEAEACALLGISLDELNALRMVK